MNRFIKILVVFVLVVGGIFAWLSWPVHTPAITDLDGSPLPGSIAEEERLSINGLNQWTLTRGRDSEAPILLVLHGGPGAGEFAWFRAYNSSLENDFVVVHWDQRGAGKSFDSATPADTMNLEQYISDIDVLVDHLRTKFARERIAILGHSWGSLLGTIYVSRHPEKVSAYIGTGQISDMRANETSSYDFTLSEAKRLNNVDAITDLEELGRPPYGVSETIVQRGWLDEFGGGLTHENRSKLTLALDALSVPEFNLLDFIALVRSALFSMDHLWTEIATVNLDKTYVSFDVPVFFLLGRHDNQTPTSLSERYFGAITAPDKELFYFEHSAHAPPWEEPELFAEVMSTFVKPRLLPDRVQ